MTIQEFQNQIEKLYFEKDEKRGIEGTFRWFVEEVGELAKALRKNDPKNLEEEFSDCLAWLVSLASLKGIDAQKCVQRYFPHCPKCKKLPCSCP
jgi:NTP pyrophosphatase (non-canonical NTP hydrolase)